MTLDPVLEVGCLGPLQEEFLTIATFKRQNLLHCLVSALLRLFELLYRGVAHAAQV